MLACDMPKALHLPILCETKLARRFIVCVLNRDLLRGWQPAEVTGQ